jgi:tetratricopeptide (TPR) repeat protein
VASAFALWRCESRASSLGAIAGLAALGWCLWIRWPRRAWGVGLVAFALVAVGLVLLATPLADGLHAKLAALTQTKSSLGQRYHLWSLAGQVLAQHPWFGAGPNVYYLHAQFAPPTFYDFTPQVLHSHSLYVGIAEGSGWIGLAAFLVVCIATADLLRRGAACADATGRERAELAGIAAALVAVLASNLLDVGQGRNTFVPLLSWTALGCALAVRASSPDAVRTRGSAVGTLGAALLFVAFAVMPALSFHAAAAARKSAADDSPESALAYASVALATWPLDPEVRQIRASKHREAGRGALALDELRALVATRPGSAAYRLTLSRAELELGDARRAKQAAQDALRMDPRGQDAGEAAFALAGACLALGEREEGESALLQGLRTEGSGWRSLPQVRVPSRAGPGEPEYRVAFVVGDRAAPSGHLQLDDLLARIEAEMRERVATKPVDARRLAGRLVDVWRAVGQPERALAVIDDFTTAARFTNSSFDLRRTELYADLGRAEDAERVRQQSAWKNDGHLVTAWARAQLAAGGAERTERVLRDAALLEEFGARDISFDAGSLGAPLAVAARLALQRSDAAHALDVLERARYDCASASARLVISQPFLARCAKLRVGRELGLAALRAVLFDAALDRELARDAKAMRNRARLLRDACTGDLPSDDEVATTCAGLGAAGESFLRAWRESAADE